jgi:hypothetical protein
MNGGGPVALDDPGSNGQDAHITELVAMLEAIRGVVDAYPEVWESLERAGISLRAPVR